MKEIIPAKALDQHIAILGKTGSGKTFAAKGVVEGLLVRDRQACILDPTGAWYGLRLMADGTRKGFPIILLGGEHGDIPLSARSGEAVARLVTEQRASVVIDTSGLTVGEYTRFFIDFAGKLYTSIRSPLHLVIDEAHYFAPQGKVPDPDTGRMLHAANRLMSGGRSRGVRAMLITQRPAKLHKDSLSCVDTLIAMRVMAPQDRGAIEDWIDGAADPKLGKQVLESLANMPRGEGWVWYPEGQFLERVTFPKIKTYDSSATPTGDGGSKPTIGEINLDAVRSALADAVKEAEANDPKALRRRIAELEKQVGQPTTDHAAIERACAARDEHWRRVVSTQTDRTANAMRAVRQIESARNVINDQLQIINQSLDTNRGELLAAEIVGTKQVQAVGRIEKGEAVHFHNSGVVAFTRKVGSAELSTLERSLLTVLAQHPNGLSKTAAVIYAGYSPNGHVSSAWGRFNAEGWTQRTADGLRISESGLAALGSWEPLPTGAGLREMWLAKLDKHEAALLRVLFSLYPDGASKSEVVSQAGYSPNGHISSAWGKFNQLGWIVRTANGVRAADMWFD